MEPKLLKCPTCNKEFAITNSMSRQRFCSRACRPEKIRYVGDKKCEQCGAIFTAKFAEQKCCSEKCRCIQISEKRTKAPLIRNCVKCGVQFSTKKKTKRFCSVKCSSAKFDPVTLTCETCKKQFTVPYRHRGLKTCGRKCMGIRSSKLHNTDVIVCCFVCGTNYAVPIAARNTNKYCSYDCFNSTTEAAQPDILKICETCNTEFSVSATKSEQRFCCHSCASTGENNGAFGKPSTLTGKPAWNRGLTVETDERLRLLGEKISVIIADKLVKGEWNFCSGFKSEWYTGVKNGGKEIFLRSSYESLFVRMLEVDDNVVSWTYEPIRIPYKFNESTLNYVPDFFVVYTDGTGCLVEIKPSTLSETDKNIAKRSAAVAWCEINDMIYVQITELELNDIPN